MTSGMDMANNLIIMDTLILVNGKMISGMDTEDALSTLRTLIGMMLLMTLLIISLKNIMMANGEMTNLMDRAYFLIELEKSIMGNGKMANIVRTTRLINYGTKIKPKNDFLYRICFFH